MDNAVQRFRDAAEAYRRTVASAGSAPDFARRVRNAVARVYLAAVFLPEGEAAGEAPPDLPEERREPMELEQRVAAALGDSVVESLPRELGELYDGLGRALALLQLAGPRELAQLRREFEAHWGRHAVNVLRPLHDLATGR